MANNGNMNEKLYCYDDHEKRHKCCCKRHQFARNNEVSNSPLGNQHGDPMATSTYFMALSLSVNIHDRYTSTTFFPTPPTY